MDNQVVAVGLYDATNPVEHAKSMQFFDEMRNAEGGWRHCLDMMVSGSHFGQSTMQFFCLQVIEHHVKTRYNSFLPGDQEVIRMFLRNWVKHGVDPEGLPHAPFVLNKAAQLAALVFVQDYPTRWPEFFTEMIAICEPLPSSVDYLLRVLLAIDGEIADREIPRTAHELQRNNIIKDAMREKAVVQLVESWYKMLTVLVTPFPLIVRLCLQVIGKYIQWIDINLVANDRFVSVLVTNLCNNDVREHAADCINEIISKGMDPVDKLKLVESFHKVLTDGAVFLAFRNQEDEEYVCKLGKLYSGMGTSIIESYWRFTKSHPGQIAEASAMLEAVERKVPLLLKILVHECDDVSATTLDFFRDYLHLLKSFRTLSHENIENYHQTLDGVIHKLRFDPSYDFAHEGEDEACFMEYRKQLKVIFDNLAQMDKSWVILMVQNRVNYVSQYWRGMSFDEVEVALLLLYYLGESVPSTMSGQWNNDEELAPVQLMMVQVMCSDIYLYNHSAVALQYFETIIRYEKFFVSHPDYVVNGLTAFLKEKGLFHPDRRVRSRCCYLFSRFIKCIRNGITADLMKHIIDAIQPLLVLHISPTKPEENLLSRDDQLYLYEVVGVLIVSGETENQKKSALMTDIINLVLYPCRVGMEQLQTVKDPAQRESIVEVLVQAIALTGRLSKAFSNQQTMKSLGCVPLFLDALGVFLQVLEAPAEESLLVQLQSSVRQYLHRLVVCLEEELLPFIPVASQGLLKNCDSKSIQDYIPLINQVICKFKKEVVPFLKQMFTPMVQGVFAALQVPVEPNDYQGLRDRQLLRRQYFQFLAAIVTNNVTDVLSAQDPNVLHEVLMTVIQGSVEFPDPVAQKACFAILRKLVDLWAGPEGPEGFMDFMYKNIVPACFVAPLKHTFDINDAQTLLALNEVANCLKTMFDKRKEEFIAFLNSYLPSLKLPAQKVQEVVSAIQSDHKNFRSYLKTFFQQLKPSGTHLNS